jgi:hypothetical protein
LGICPCFLSAYHHFAYCCRCSLTSPDHAYPACPDIILLLHPWPAQTCPHGAVHPNDHPNSTDDRDLKCALLFFSSCIGCLYRQTSDFWKAGGLDLGRVYVRRCGSVNRFSNHLEVVSIPIPDPISLLWLLVLVQGLFRLVRGWAERVPTLAPATRRPALLPAITVHALLHSYHPDLQVSFFLSTILHRRTTSRTIPKDCLDDSTTTDLRASLRLTGHRLPQSKLPQLRCHHTTAWIMKGAGG